jgi:membrane-associated phospholipid phosphatase
LVLAATLVAAPVAARSEPGKSKPKPAGFLPGPEPDWSGEKIVWDPNWPRFKTWQWVTTGVFAGLAVGFAIVPPRKDNPWQGYLPGDEATRDALRLGSEGSRRLARDVSDGLLSLMFAYPFLVDALIVTAWYHESPGTAWQMTLVNLQTMAMVIGIQSTVKALTSRERPYVRVCGTELPQTARDCEANSRYYSFFSGHSAGTFASAGLICMHHLNLKLHGGGAADIVPCAAGFGVAALTATLRIMGDQHYLSDVLVGAAVGTVLGLGMPWLLVYRHGRSLKKERDQASQFNVTLVPMPTGAGLVGTF